MDERLAASAAPLLLVRYGEIGLKGENRPAFEGQLLRQMKRSLRRAGPFRIERSHGRLFVETPEPSVALQRLARLFGVVSISPALRVPAAIEPIEAAALTLLDEAVAKRNAASGEAVRTFKVEARRANKGFPLTSIEINRRVGAYLHASRPDLRVDVHEPDVVVAIEIREEAYLFTETLPGPGGLPVGSGGRAHLLLSGGIDSPVAGWMALKRGMTLEAVHFHTPPFTSDRSREKVVDLCRCLATWGGPVPLHIVRFTEVQKAIYGAAPAELGVTLMRRMMFRIAERLAAARGGQALVTGESLGQVASQTIESIAVIGAVAHLPVLRPLIGLDKVEIVARARQIETYEISIRPYEDCCSLFVPKHPRTRPTVAEVEAAERALGDFEPLLEEAVARTERLDVDETGPRISES